MLIKNKKAFYGLARKGLCGNTPRTWYTIEDLVNDTNINSAIPISCRNYKKSKQKIFQTKAYVLKSWYRVGLIGSYFDDYVFVQGTPRQICVKIKKIKRNHIISSILKTNKMLQGELTWLNGNWYLYYTYDQGVLRNILSESGKHATGFRVLNMLKNQCTPSDYNDIMDLFNEYTHEGQYPVIEFSVVKDNFGILPGRNTIIWEIRHY